MYGKTHYGIESVLFALILSCMAVGSGAAVHFGDSESLQDSDADLLPVDLISVDDSVKGTTIYWVLLTADDDAKLKYLDTIDMYPKISDAEKESIKSALKLIWEKYPMKFTKVPNKHGSVTYIGFADEAHDFTLAEEEQEVLKTVEYILTDARETSPQMRWNSDVHSEFIIHSMNRYGLSYAQKAGDYSIKPDQWKAVSIPDWIYYTAGPVSGLTGSTIKGAINGLFHSYSHAYDPNFLGQKFGSAPEYTKKYADIAYNDYRNGQTTDAAENLGYASHFLTDVGNPLHTGMCLQQFADYVLVGGDMGKTVHGRYEAYVSRNWDSKFANCLNTNTCIGNRDWSEGCKELATVSNGYSDTIYTTVHDSTNAELDQNANLKSCTYNRVLLTAKYTNGLVKYVKDG